MSDSDTTDAYKPTDHTSLPSRGSSHEETRVLPGAARDPSETQIATSVSDSDGKDTQKTSPNVNNDSEKRIDPQLTATKPDGNSSSADTKANTSSDPLQVAAQLYPWMYMTSTLDACFKDAEETAQKDLKTRAETLDQEEAGISDHRVRFEAERLVEFYDELSSDKFAKDAPKIMQNFLAHGDACTRLEAEALEIATRDVSQYDFETADLPLREYNDVLERLNNLRMEAFEIESHILRLTVSTSTASAESDSPDAEASEASAEPSTPASTSSSSTSSAGGGENTSSSIQSAAVARSQIAPIFSACLPIVRAREGNIAMAQQLVEGAKQNLSMTVHLESIGNGGSDYYDDDEDSEDDDEVVEGALPRR